MKPRILALLSLIALVACRDVTVSRPAEAQGQFTGGTSRVWTLDGGLCTGSGKASSPINCTVETDDTITGTGTGGDPFSATSALQTVDFALFGDGSDGTHVFDGSTTILGLVPSANTYTLTRDIFCASCTINVGVSITGPYRFFDSGTLTLDGKIHRNGNAGGTPTAGASLASGVLPAAAAGGAGGSTAGAAASAGGNGGVAPFGCVNTGGGAGAAGDTCKGGGGGSGAGGVGAAAGSVTLTAASNGTPRIIRLGLEGVNRSNTTWQTASGGGGGRGDAANARAGGGGGGAGGYIVVSARRIVGSGSIESKGGNGGPGQSGGNTGGGGGGAGGLIILLIGSGSYPTMTNTGGAGGALQGTGTIGGAGGDGLIIKYRLGVSS